MPQVINERRSEVPFRKRAVNGIGLYISESSLNTMIGHADSTPDKEVLGLMIGKIFRDDDGIYSKVHRTMTSSLISSRIGVRFDSHEGLFDHIDDMDADEVIVGWYHSHIGIGCFMSDIDVRTHTGIFGTDCGSAVVIDPVRQEIKAFGNPDCAETMFVIMDD